MPRSVAPSSAQLRALAELKAPKGREPHLGAILCPGPMSIDAWERLAVPMQAKLMAAGKADAEEPVVAA